MPKAEAGSAKALANKMKSRGLQKLRWYCEMCEKQCRDENGFKCHTQSESHLRQMRLFAEDTDGFLSQFSQEFERGFMDVLSNRHGTKRMKANAVYQEYIANKTATHMNATCWTTLTEFVMHLGKEGKCVVDETEQGWFVQFIDRDPKLVEKQRLLEMNQKQDMDEETRQQRALEARIVAAEKRKREQLSQGGGGFLVGEDEESAAMASIIDINRERDLKISLQTLASYSSSSSVSSSVFKSGGGAAFKKSKFLNVFEEEDNKDGKDDGAGVPDDKIADEYGSSGSGSSGGDESASASRPNSITPFVLEDQSKKMLLVDDEDKVSRKENWLHPSIVVKIVNKKVGDGKFYKQKGIVRRVHDDFVGEVELPSGSVIKLDQDDLETVIPKEDGSVLVVNGLARGTAAVVVSINEKDFNCDVRISSGPHAGKIVKKAYEDICKV